MLEQLKYYDINTPGVYLSIGVVDGVVGQGEKSIGDKEEKDAGKEGHEPPSRVIGEKILAHYDVLEKPRVSIDIVEGFDGRRRYIVREPQLNNIAKKLLDEIRRKITSNVKLLDSISGIIDFDHGLEYSIKLVGRMGKRYRKRLGEEGLYRVAYYIARDFVGYGVLDPMVRDKNVEDITCNGLREPVFIFHRDFEWLESNIVFTSEDELERIVMKLALRAGQEPSVAKPIVEGVIRPEGYRVHIILDVISRRGHSFTIRKFRAEPFTIVELINRKTLDPLVAAYLWLGIEYKQGIVIYGPTGAGKTTLMNALALLLPPEYKIVTAEDTPEIMLPFHDNWVAMVTRLSSDPYIQSVTLQAQVESALRQRPDVIILGEIRSREAYSFFQAVATGHGGLTTVHAESTEVLINRLAAPPMNVPKSIIAAVRIFVFITRLQTPEGFVRKVVRVDESWGYDPEMDSIRLNHIIKWDRDRDQWYMSSRESSTLKAIADMLALSYEDVFRDLVRRATILYWAAEKNFDIVMFHTIMRRYRRDPEAVYELAKNSVGEYPIRIGGSG